MQDLVRQALADVRRLAVQLRPAILDDFGLLPALERLTQGLREQGALDVSFDANLAESERLPGELETALFRIAQEALTNVVKHADARTARVGIERRDASVTLTVEDDGIGLDPADVPDERLGLVGIREA